MFDFIGKMIRRDWLFRRAVLSQTWIPLFLIVGVILAIFRYGMTSLILGDGTSANILPDLLGLVIVAMCINLPFSVFSKASWIYLIAPVGSARPFAKGVFRALWMHTAGLPHIVLLFFLLNFVHYYGRKIFDLPVKDDISEDPRWNYDVSPVLNATGLISEIYEASGGFSRETRE